MISIITSFDATDKLTLLTNSDVKHNMDVFEKINSSQAFRETVYTDSVRRIWGHSRMNPARHRLTDLALMNKLTTRSVSLTSCLHVFPLTQTDLQIRVGGNNRMCLNSNRKSFSENAEDFLSLCFNKPLSLLPGYGSSFGT